MTFIKNVLGFLILLCIIGNVNAGYLDDWSDDALCGWLDNPSPPEHIVEEAIKRGISCPGEAASKHLIENAQSSTTSKIKIYDIIFSEELLEELLAIPPEENASDFSKNFKNYRLAFIQDEIVCGFNLRRIVYENKAEGEIEGWDMAYGSITFKGLNADFKGTWSKNMGGLSSDSRYFNDEINIKLTKDGHLVGKMAYFTHTIDSDEAPRKPLFIEITKHPKTKPLNYKNINLDNSAEFWIDVEDWAGGIMSLFQCKDRKKEMQEEMLIAKISELSIFNTSDQVFSLKLNNVDFIETKPYELERSEEYLKPFQIHKSVVFGKLNSKANGTEMIDFVALVFKQADNQEEKLVINLDAPTLEPLSRHSDLLRQECGKDLIDQWGWMGFITKTNNINSATNQQCHYDYFKEANDKESWELFQAALGGANSILDYLQNPEKIAAKQDQEKANNRAAIQAEKVAKLKEELSIFEIDGETFNLALGKGDFIETGPFELERSEEYLQPYQLHKAFVQGNLRLNSNKKIKFKTLVFKHADTKEKKLVIHVGEMSLERHSDSLQKKCGPKVMEWGWLSFISQTTDIVNARSQQCIHDYFKEANDKESFELFKAVLSGTDSILDYLKAEVIE